MLQAQGNASYLNQDCVEGRRVLRDILAMLVPFIYKRYK